MSRIADNVADWMRATGEWGGSGLAPEGQLYFIALTDDVTKLESALAMSPNAPVPGRRLSQRLDELSQGETAIRELVAAGLMLGKDRYFHPTDGARQRVVFLVAWAQRVDPLLWQDTYSIGVAKLDAQHRELFGRLHRLGAAIRSGNAVAVGDVLGSLAIHVAEHFRDEEQAMVDAHYPEIVAHRAAHEQFLTEFRERMGKFQVDGTTPGLALRLHRWFAEWMHAHLLGLDQQFGRHVAGSASGNTHTDSPHSGVHR